ncbi:MAG: hypothetical protein BWY45_01423 [Euryarchaeota archaeon ADurb.Bin294]|nr:MAG: hypothetical protein BWY45_01423 [Euryarchaeota archaeon ADurb.Bin294]
MKDKDTERCQDKNLKIPQDRRKSRADEEDTLVPADEIKRIEDTCKKGNSQLPGTKPYFSPDKDQQQEKWRKG